MEDAVKTAWKKLITENSEMNWLTTETKDSFIIKLSGSGKGGYEEMLKSFNKDVISCVCLKALAMGKDDAIDGEFYVVIFYVPESIDTMKKARSGVQKSQIMKIFSAFHLFIDASKIEDFGKKTIVEMLNASCGSNLQFPFDEPASWKI